MDLHDFSCIFATLAQQRQPLIHAPCLDEMELSPQLITMIQNSTCNLYRPIGKVRMGIGSITNHRSPIRFCRRRQHLLQARFQGPRCEEAQCLGAHFFARLRLAQYPGERLSSSPSLRALKIPNTYKTQWPLQESVS